MSRDKSRYRYFVVGIDRDSKLIKCLEEDAKELGSKLLPRVIVARLGDYYRIMRKLDEGALFLTATPINEDKETSKDNASEAISVWEMDD